MLSNLEFDAIDRSGSRALLSMLDVPGGNPYAPFTIPAPERQTI